MCLYFVLIYETKLLQNPVVSTHPWCCLLLRALKLLCCSLTLLLIWWDFNLEGCCVLFHSVNFPLGNMLTPRRWRWVRAVRGPTGLCPWLAASRARWCTVKAATQTTRGRRRGGAPSGGRAPTQPLPLPISAEYFQTPFFSNIICLFSILNYLWLRCIVVFSSFGCFRFFFAHVNVMSVNQSLT